MRLGFWTLLLHFLLLAAPVVHAQSAPDERGQVLPTKGKQDMPSNDATDGAPTLAMRLIFEYDGEEVRLVSQQPVDVAVTGFDISRTQRAGYYVETRNATGQALARVPAREAFSGSAEVFPEQPGEPISRVDVQKPHGAFSIVVPVPEGADHVSVVRVAPVSHDAAQPSSRSTSAVEGASTVTEIGKFTLQISR